MFLPFSHRIFRQHLPEASWLFITFCRWCPYEILCNQHLGSKIRQNPNFAFSCLFRTNLTQDYGHNPEWNLMKFYLVKEFELSYVHAENQCIWMVFGGQINSVYWFLWISVQHFGLKKTREIWLADFCHFLEKYTIKFKFEPWPWIQNWHFFFKCFLYL